MDLLIKNGRLVLLTKIILADLLIKEGKISRIDSSISQKGVEIIDAQGAYILAAGIDPHVHLSLPTPYGLSADNFHSGSYAAIAGGTTTIIDFVTPKKGEKLVDAFERRKAEADACSCDYAFHMSIIEWNSGMEQQMEYCVNHLGITSFKIYLAYKDSIGISFDDLENVMNAAKKTQSVVMVHAELGDKIEELKASALQENHKEVKYHASCRPDYTETEAIKKVIELVQNTNCTTYVAHVSTHGALQLIAQARSEGLPIYSETCPHYFTFNDSYYQKSDSYAANLVMSPPLRSEENRKGVIHSITEGNVYTIATDHCPFMQSQKNAANSFADIPNGIGSIQYRLSLFYSQFVYKQQLNLIQMAKLTASNAAKLFHLSSKGQIEIGFDADLILWESVEEKLTEQKDYSNSDINSYANEVIYGKARIVIKSGQIVFKDGLLRPNIPQGHYLYRK